MADASIALNRFGLGARAGDAPPADPKAWLHDQLDRFDPRPAAVAAAPDRHAVAADLADYTAVRKTTGRKKRTAGNPAMAADPSLAARQQARIKVRDDFTQAAGARLTAAVASDTPFAERLVHFWSNHFALSAEKLPVKGLAGPFEFEAIRSHVLGRFGDMLSAVEHHPAMLIYLDQAQSIGPNSPAGLRIDARGKRKAGLNENLGREIMELHTLGVRTGYDQADVTEFARALTGWTVGGIGRGAGRRGNGAPGDFLFAAQLHEPGARAIIGKRYDQAGEQQAQAVLADLAASPATATHISTKLARHFAGDTPPPALVDRLQASFLKTGGDLPSLYRVLIESPETWTPVPAKFKSPWEWTVSSMRAVDAGAMPGKRVDGLLNQLGQPLWKPGSPAGYDDIAANWAGPDAVMRRVEAAQRIAATAAETLDARTLADTLFPPAVSAATAQQLARAESPQQALALLLVAPESLRR